MADADPLTAYNRKRDFSRTREPAGRRGRRQGNGFIVQQHDATRLHYDFRLEMDGVLKSLEVTRGASLDPADKPLAARTDEDRTRTRVSSSQHCASRIASSA